MRYFKYLMAGLLLTLMPGCDKETENTQTLNETIKSIMDEWYLWYDKMPTVDVATYDKPQALIDALKYKQLDRWSFIITDEEYNQYFVEGKYYGHGMGYAFGTDNKMRATFVFQSSAIHKAGVRRGWIIKKVNGTAPNSSNVSGLLGVNQEGIENTFEFVKPDQTDTVLKFSKAEVKMDMVLASDTFHIKSKVVGYLVLYGFIADAENEVAGVFKTFKQLRVSELIVDLRYNGGGWIDDAAKMGALIGGTKAENQMICKLQHNNNKTDQDFEVTMKPNQDALAIDRVFFITAQTTASASELLMNGLKPFIEVKSIGTPTSGKPVGMYKQDLTEFKYVFFPIMFKTVNKNGEGDYFNGIEVDKEAADDIAHDFGDRNEGCLFQALHYIEFGSFAASRKSTISALGGTPSETWWGQIFGAY